MLMRMAEVVSLRSTCSRQSVGVILARDGRVLSSGYNGAPAGMPHCDHTCDCGAEEMGRKEHARSTNFACASVRPCEISVHAECNAIAFAARYGVSTESATLVTTFSPCLACAQLAINAGITRVVWGRPHRDQRGLDLLNRSDLVAVSCISVVDAI